MRKILGGQVAMAKSNSDRKSGNRIAIYIRVSTEEQAQNPEGSIKNQKERLYQAVQLKNMQENFGEAVAVHIDRARSGANTKRKELQKMLATMSTHGLQSETPYPVTEPRLA